jgi:hypothetical protein
MAWAFLALVACDHDPLGELREYGRAAIAATPVRAAFFTIPLTASVSAEDLSGTWLAGRERVTRWPALDAIGGKCPEWLVTLGPRQTDEARARCGPAFAEERQIQEWHILKTLPPHITH